jgi:hypothetical protein
MLVIFKFSSLDRYEQHSIQPHTSTRKGTPIQYNIQISNEGTMSNVHYTRSSKNKKEKLCREISLDQQTIKSAKLNSPLSSCGLRTNFLLALFVQHKLRQTTTLLRGTGKEFTDINNHD